MFLNSGQKRLRRRIVEISYDKGLSHLGSCLSVIDILEAIYAVKKQEERFVLSSGHAGVALYVLLEDRRLLPTAAIKDLEIHPKRNPDLGIDVSTGSLGLGLPIALGMALADRTRNVYCVVSDGECAEGSIWEALRVGQEQQVSNLKIVVNANGWGAYTEVSLTALFDRFKGFGYLPARANGHDTQQLKTLLNPSSGGMPTIIFAQTTVEQLPFLKGQDAHYYLMTEADYATAMEIF